MRRITVVDLETTGLNQFYSQILEVSAVTIDQSGTWVGAFHESCRMDLHRLADPRALFINNYPLHKLNSGQSLHSLLAKLNAYIEEHSPQILVAHNSPFDFNHVSNAFYQNLTTGDLYQWKTNGNHLVCSLRLLKGIYSLDRDSGIKFPKDKQGHPIFNLQALCDANGIPIQAHTSQGDVNGLVELMYLVLDKSPKMFEIAVQSASKSESLKLLFGQFYFIANTGSLENFSTRALVPVALNQKKTRAVVMDLGLMEKTNLAMSIPEIYKCLSETKKAILKDARIFQFALNKANLIGDNLDHHDSLDTKIAKDILFRRASSVRRNKTFCSNALDTLSLFEQQYENGETPEEKIYFDFPSKMEKRFISSFNAAVPKDKIKVIETFKKILPYQRFISLGYRVCLENFPESITPALKEQYSQWCITRLYENPEGQQQPWITHPTALKKIEKLLADNPNKANQILSFKKYFTEKEKMLYHDENRTNAKAEGA